MVRNTKALRKFERNLHSQEKLSYPEALKLFNALYKEARAFKVFSSKSPLQGLEGTFRIARFLNSLTVHD